MKIIKLFFLITVLALAPLVLCGCNEERPFILFSSSPFTKEHGYTPRDTFKKTEKIYYLIYNPREFKTRLLKVQVFKKDSSKSEFWGYDYLYNKTIELNNKKFYTDYFVINKSGVFMFQIFEFTNTLDPVIKGVVKVED